MGLKETKFGLKPDRDAYGVPRITTDPLSDVEPYIGIKVKKQEQQSWEDGYTTRDWEEEKPEGLHQSTDDGKEEREGRPTWKAYGPSKAPTFGDKNHGESWITVKANQRAEGYTNAGQNTGARRDIEYRTSGADLNEASRDNLTTARKEKYRAASFLKNRDNQKQKKLEGSHDNNSTSGKRRSY